MTILIRNSESGCQKKTPIKYSIVRDLYFFYNIKLKSDLIEITILLQVTINRLRSIKLKMHGRLKAMN